jgi:hypothetical protein
MIEREGATNQTGYCATVNAFDQLRTRNRRRTRGPPGAERRPLPQ